MSQGVVKWFNNKMKFGFILTPQNREVFVHFSDIECEGYKTLKKGEVVEFEVQETPKGTRAVHVKLLKPRRRGKKDSGANGIAPT
ncbi:MAG: cold-shock protein [Candidatus Omnitrophota bacterium]